MSPLSTLRQTPVHASAIDLNTAREYFEEARLAEGGQSIWPVPLTGPLMFVDQATRSVVANERDLAGLLHLQNGVWIGQLPKAINPANTSVDIGGKRWAMILWPLPDDKYTRRRLLMHESFHRIQSKIGVPGTDRSNAHLATADARIWMRLEWRALTEALLNTGVKRKQALTDALVFRARRQALTPQAAEDERQLELSEGLAEYTGLVASGLPRSSLADRAAVQLSQYESRASFVRSFAYASGPAYGLLLDASGRAWRKEIRGSTDLGVLTARAFVISVPKGITAEGLVARYSGMRMVAEEKARDAARLATEQRLRGLFIDGPVLRIPVVGRFSFSFDPNGAVPIDGVGTVYESSRISDEWGLLEVSSGGVLIERRADGAITGIVVPAPGSFDLPLRGNGWQLTLESGWSISKGKREGDTQLERMR